MQPSGVHESFWGGSHMLQWKARFFFLLAALGLIASALGNSGWDWLHWGW